MSDSKRSGLDAVDHGPLPSERSSSGAPGGDASAGDDPGVSALRARFGGAITQHRVSAGDQHVVWVDPERSLEVLSWLRDDPAQRYDLLADVTCVDYGGGRPLDVVYQLWSIPHKRALRVRCSLPLDRLRIASVVPLWNAANWLEREVYDLFGVTFTDHPDLRRILMPLDYAEGHPLRKDFPLLARLVKPWPGIVDVEPMPGEPEAPAEGEPAMTGSGEPDAPAEGEGDTAEGGEA
jgi:NADH-quinone oxidoreductase subunit C